MNRKYIKCFLILIIGILCTLPCTLSNATSYSYMDNYNGYVIENYNIDMVVNENNTFDITETIIANFYVSKHGIYRKIPLRNNIERVDGTTSKNKAKITNLTVDKESKIYNSNGYKVIQIGDPYRTVTGINSYTIKYTYDIGRDKLKNADELYYNLIGTEWDTSVKNVNFRITMPKEFDSSSLGFSTGELYSIGTSIVDCEVNDNVITGRTTRHFSSL